MDAPQNPAGEYQPEPDCGPERRAEFIAIIENAPAELRRVVADLSDSQLDTRYRNWTIRQIVHHLADSHIHSFMRFKWALTEDTPTIKPYDESRSAELPDAIAGDVRASLAILQGIHARWVQMLRAMTEEQFARAFFHPEQNRAIKLNEAVGIYAWHSRHHTAQIAWLRANHGW